MTTAELDSSGATPVNLEMTTGAGVGHTANERLDHLRQGRETFARREWHVAYHALLGAAAYLPA